jgi:hypothetical protein
MREKHRLRTFASRMQRKIFGPKRDEVTWERTGLYKEEIYDLNSSTNIILMIKPKRRR